MVGLDLPVDPRRRHIFVTDSFSEIRHPIPLVTDMASGFYCRSEQGAILMSPGDIGAQTEYTASVDWSVLEQTVEKAVRRMPALERAQIRHAWAGLRPLTPDGRGILDWAPGIDGLYLAIGFCGHGFQHSPAAGRILADVITGRDPQFDLTPFAAERFASPPATVSGERYFV